MAETWPLSRERQAFEDKGFWFGAVLVWCSERVMTELTS